MQCDMMRFLHLSSWAVVYVLVYIFLLHSKCYFEFKMDFEKWLTLKREVWNFRKMRWNFSIHIFFAVMLNYLYISSGRLKSYLLFEMLFSKVIQILLSKLLKFPLKVSIIKGRNHDIQRSLKGISQVLDEMRSLKDSQGKMACKVANLEM